MFDHPTVLALNHLLKQNSWATRRLAPYAGKTARFQIPPFSFACTINGDGTLRSAYANANPDVQCVIPPSLLPRIALNDESAHKEIAGEGDSALLQEIFFLSRNLRWDAAEDLSRVTGDIAAERIVRSAAYTRQLLRDSAANLSMAAVEYLTEERPLLAKPGQVASFIRQVDVMRDDVARLEQRIGRLLAGKQI